MKDWDPLLVAAIQYLTLFVDSIINWNGHDFLCLSYRTGEEDSALQVSALEFHAIFCKKYFIVYQQAIQASLW